MRYPTPESSVSSIAVHHQLHCLVCFPHLQASASESNCISQDTLRRGYYALLSPEASSASPSDHKHPSSAHEDPPSYEDHSSHASAPHVRHCIDLLRQSLMCCGDANLEPVDEELGGVTGWGVERRCRDYGALGRWAEEHAAREEGESEANTVDRGIV